MGGVGPTPTISGCGQQAPMDWKTGKRARPQVYGRVSRRPDSFLVRATGGGVGPGVDRAKARGKAEARETAPSHVRTRHSRRL